MGRSVIERGKGRLILVTSVGIAMIALFLVASLAFGPVDMAFGTAIDSLLGAFGKPSAEMSINELIVYDIRLPRAIGAMAVGVGLSVAGVVFQAVIRNPLVDPYITGVSSGAGLGATSALVIGLSFLSVYSNFTVPIAAMAGALIAFAFTMAIAEGSGGRSVNYVLGGVIVGMALSSMTTLLMIYAGDKIHGVLFWLFGSFTDVGWDNVWMIVIPVAVMGAIVLLYAKELNLILLGEEQARQLGLNVRVFSRSMLILASVLTAICVAFTGIIGFVGLIVPHASRLIVGSDHRLLIPTTMVMGANVLLLGDLISKLALEPVELPIGAIMTLIGAPFFGYLLIRKGRSYVG